MAKASSKEIAAKAAIDETVTMPSEDGGSLAARLAPDGAGAEPAAEAAQQAAARKTEEAGAAKEIAGKSRPELFGLSELADRFRVVSWRQAALLRYMGWEDGKMVSEDEYRDALKALEYRRIGGGRK